jgi:NitT/TauT family transport system substrate-binding protein
MASRLEGTPRRGSVSRADLSADRELRAFDLLLSRRDFMYRGSLAGAGLVLLACGAGGGQATATPSYAGDYNGPVTKVDFMEGGHALSQSFLYVPIRLGYFRDVGLDASYTTAPGGATESIAAVLNGSVLIAFAGSSTALTAISKGVPLRLMCSTASAFGTDITFTKKWATAKGVTPNSPLKDRIAAMRGARIAVSGIGANAHQFVQFLFKAYLNLSADSEAQITQVATSGMGPALATDRVDAISSPFATGDQAADQGSAIVIIRGRDVDQLKGLPYTAAIVSQKSIQEKRPLLKAAVTALARGIETIRTNPTLAKSVARNELPNYGSAVFNAGWTGVELSLPAPGMVITEPEYNLVNKFYTAVGQKNDVQYKDAVDTSIAEEVKAELKL